MATKKKKDGDQPADHTLFATQKLIDFIYGDLDEESRLEMELEIESSQFTREAIEGLTEHGRENDLNASLQRLQEEVEKRVKVENPRRNINLNLFFQAAAMIMLLVSAAFYFNNSQATPEYLFKEHFTVYPNLVDISRSSDPAAKRLERAMLAYDAKDYPRSRILLEDLLDDQPDHTDAQFYCALIASQNGDTDKAIRLFIRLLESDANQYGSHVEWYYSLALIKAGDLEKAYKRLKTLSSDSYHYRIAVDKLLGQLQKQIKTGAK